MVFLSSHSAQHSYGKIQKSIINIELEAKKRSSFLGKTLVLMRLNRCVKEEISDVVGYLNEFHMKLTDEKVSKIVFGILSKFTEKEFIRSSINEEVISKLYLNLGLDKSSNSKTVNDVMLALNMGMKPIKNKGAYGSLIYRNYQGQSIAVFKNLKGSPFGLIHKIGDCISKLLNISWQKFHLPFENERNLGCGLSEIAAYYFSVMLKFYLVPDTYMVNFEGNTGSLQEFVTGFEEARSVLITDNPKEETILEFQKMCVLDYLIGNLDRNFENWLVKTDENSQIQSIKMIDNGNAFVRHHLPDKLGINSFKNQYVWKTLALSNLEIKDDIKRLIRRIDNQKIEHVVQRIKMDYPSYRDQLDVFFESSKAALLDRLKVLKRAIEEEKNLSELAEFRSETQIKEYIKSQPLRLFSSSSSIS